MIMDNQTRLLKVFADVLEVDIVKLDERPLMCRLTLWKLPIFEISESLKVFWLKRGSTLKNKNRIVLLQ
jgi:hypothetical protein